MSSVSIHLVCPAAPYANAPLHMGRIGGSMLPADVYARYLRKKGRRVLFLLVFDCYGTPIMQAAKAAHMDCTTFVGKWINRGHKTLQLWDICPDKVHSTMEHLHLQYVTKTINQYVAMKYIVPSDEQDYYCTQCSKTVVDRLLRGICPCGAALKNIECEVCSRILDPSAVLQPRCGTCNSQVCMVDTKNYRINLYAKKAILAQHYDKTYNLSSFYTEDNTYATKTILRNIEWGLPSTLQQSAVVYVWFEALLSYLSFTQQYHAHKYEFYHFIGKDNLHFHTVILGHILLYKNMRLPRLLKVRNWYTLDTYKQSASSAHYLDLYELQQVINWQPLHTDLFRAYLTYTDTVNKDMDLSLTDYNTFVKLFANTIHNLIYRVHRYCMKNNITIVLKHIEDPVFDFAMLDSDCGAAWQNLLHRANTLNKTFQETRLGFESDYSVRIWGTYSILYDLVYFMPSYVKNWQTVFLKTDMGYRINFETYLINTSCTKF